MIRGIAPDAVFGPSFPKTRKGTVAHLAPGADSVAARHRPARPAFVVFPRYVEGSELSVRPITKTHAFFKLAANSFNYEVLGPDGFDAVVRLIRDCSCYRLEYGDIAQAALTIDGLLAESRPASTNPRSWKRS